MESKGANSYLAYDLGKHVKDIRLSVVATGDFTRAELSKAGELGILPSYNVLKRMNN